MTRANKALAVVVMAVLGLWGCAQGPAGGAGAGEKIKALESKCTKLEDDYRAVAAARDQLRKKVTEADEQRVKLRGELDQLQVLAKEHEELKVQLTTRTTERDNLQVQFEQFRKGLRSLLGQADAAVTGTAAQPAVSAAEPPTPGKS